MEKRKGKEPPDPEVLRIFSKNLSSCITTNARLAEKVRISEQSVADYVNGISLPRADILCRISEAIGKSMQWLLTGKDQGSPKCPVKCDEKIQVLCGKVKDVINAPGSYSGALETNIHSFHDAVEFQRSHDNKIADMEKRLEDMARKLQNIEAVHSPGRSGDTGEPESNIATKTKAG